MTHPSPSSLTRESVQECGRLPNQFQSLIPATAKPSLHSGPPKRGRAETRQMSMAIKLAPVNIEIHLPAYLPPSRSTRLFTGASGSYLWHAQLVLTPHFPPS